MTDVQCHLDAWDGPGEAAQEVESEEEELVEEEEDSE